MANDEIKSLTEDEMRALVFATKAKLEHLPDETISTLLLSSIATMIERSHPLIIAEYLRGKADHIEDQTHEISGHA